MPGVRTFRELKVWQHGISLVKAVYQATEKLPDSERYGLRPQMRRCAVSIPSNIAEGFRRIHSKEFRRFLRIARGSLAELETQVVIAGELGYIGSPQLEFLTGLIESCSRMIVTLARKIDKPVDVSPVLRTPNPVLRTPNPVLRTSNSPSETP